MAQGIPKESVQPVQGWTRPFAFEHRDLLSEGQDFESCITPTAKENPERRKECEDSRSRTHSFNMAQRGFFTGGGQGVASPWFYTSMRFCLQTGWFQKGTSLPAPCSCLCTGQTLRGSSLA